jgi:hypothetical protein
MNAIKRFYSTYIKRWVKAIAAAVGGAIAGLLINWVQGTTPIPTTKDELYTLLIATLLPPILALFSPANKITQKQLDKDPNVVGGTVIDTPAPAVATDIDDTPPPTPGLGGGVFRNPWK